MSRASSLENVCELLGTIIDGISDHLMLLDVKTYEIIEVNKAFLCSYGSGSTDIVGKTCYEVTHNVDRPCPIVEPGHRCPIDDCLKNRGSVLLEHVHHDAEGNKLYALVSAYPVLDESGEVRQIIHLSRDITDRRRLEEMAREQEKLKAILELSGGLSHELNQPLTSLLISLRELHKRCSRSGLEPKLMEIALDDAERILSISEKLLNIKSFSTTDYVGSSRIIDLDKSTIPEE